MPSDACFSKTLGYYILSSLLAIMAGLLLVNLIQPGVGATMTGAAAQQPLPELATPSSPVELILDIVPDNVIQAAASADMLAIIFFSILFGQRLPPCPTTPQRTLTDLFGALFQTMMRLTSGIMKFLPIGVFALITRMVATTGFEAFRPLALYAATVCSGITFHLLVSLPLLLVFLGRISPRIHFANMRQLLLIAFSTSSSGATLPVTIDSVKNKVGVS